jgi:hypothetical protein
MRAGTVVVALWFGACVSSEVAPIGAARPSRPEGCPVQVYPALQPPYPVTQVASARAKCHFTQGRNACIEELKKQACAVGADTIVGFSEGMMGEYTFIAATLAARTAGPAAPGPGVATKRQSGAAGSGQGQGQPDDSCSPICSPGFACQAGQCVPQCNPPCDAGEVCNRKRECQPAPTKTAPASATGASL